MPAYSVNHLYDAPSKSLYKLLNWNTVGLSRSATPYMASLINKSNIKKLRYIQRAGSPKYN